MNNLEPEIKYWSNGAVRSGIPLGANCYFNEPAGDLVNYISHNDEVDDYYVKSKIVFLDKDLCKTHRQEILDRQALEQKVWEIMDVTKHWPPYAIWFDGEHWDGGRKNHMDANQALSREAMEYLLSYEVTDYQRALWIEDWELAREYKSKQ